MQTTIYAIYEVSSPFMLCPMKINSIINEANYM